MGRFLESEKLQQARFKAISPYISEKARTDGVYSDKSRPFCLPLDHAEENLVPEIRQSALKYFAKHEIKWHDGQNGKPSNHLCDSQVCCVNFLFPFSDKPDELALLLRPVFPTIRKMLPVEDERFVTFEWIGLQSYLGERISRNGKRTRGALFTSADGLVMFEHIDGKRQMVSIEWKYTESYSGASLVKAKSGTDRTEIYKPLYDRDDCPLRKDLLPRFASLFFEPFYQLMRQQFLANEMEKAGESGAQAVSVLHIAPAHNTNFRKVTSPELLGLGTTATGVWSRLVQIPGKFISIDTEQLFGHLGADQLPSMQAWLQYIGARYPWVRAGTALPSRP